MKEVSVEVQLERSRDALRALFPVRAEELQAVLMQTDTFPNVESWRLEQLSLFIGALGESVDDLEKAVQAAKLGYAGWVTRNLLELYVWVHFCTESADNAKRFNDDLWRDISGFLRATERLAVQNSDPSVKSLRPRLIEIAEVWGGIQELDDDFKRVSEAAQEIGYGVGFAQGNKMLSKIAHPTAFLIGRQLPKGHEMRTCIRIFALGVKLATSALSGIDNFVSSQVRRFT